MVLSWFEKSHPEVQLRKKARLGGWVDVMKQCPKCNDPKEGGGLPFRGEETTTSQRRQDPPQHLKKRGEDYREPEKGHLKRSHRSENEKQHLERSHRSDHGEHHEKQHLEKSHRRVRQSTRQQSGHDNRHVGIDRDREREKHRRVRERSRQRSDRNHVSDRMEGRPNRQKESSHRVRDSSRPDPQHAPSRRDIQHNSRPIHRRTVSSSHAAQYEHTSRPVHKRTVSSNHGVDDNRKDDADPKSGLGIPSRKTGSRRNIETGKRPTKEPSSRRINENSTRHRHNRRRDSSSSSSDSSSSSSSLSSYFERPMSGRQTQKDKKSAPQSNENKPVTRSRADEKKHKGESTPLYRRQKSDRETPRTTLHRDASRKNHPKASRGRTLSPKPSHKFSTTSATRQHLRGQFLSRSDRSGDVIIEPTYKNTKDQSLSASARDTAPRSHTSKPEERRKRKPSPAGRQSSSSTRPVQSKSVNLDCPPPAKSANETDSDRSFNESIDFTSYRRPSRESFDEIVNPQIYSTEEVAPNEVSETASLADSNFSETLGDGNSDEKDHNGDSVSNFPKDTVQSHNPESSHSINETRDESEGDKVGLMSEEYNSSKNIGHFYVPRSSHLKGRQQSESLKNHLGHDQYNISASSLNFSEPSLLETSADNSPSIPEIYSRVSEHPGTTPLQLHPPKSFQTNINTSERNTASDKKQVYGLGIKEEMSRRGKSLNERFRSYDYHLAQYMLRNLYL